MIEWIKKLRLRYQCWKNHVCFKHGIPMSLTGSWEDISYYCSTCWKELDAYNKAKEAAREARQRELGSLIKKD